MARIKLGFLYPLAEALGSEEITIALEKEESLEKVLEKLVAGNEKARAQLYDGGKIRGDFIIMKNGVGILHLEALKTPVSDRDEITILPAIAGG